MPRRRHELRYHLLLARDVVDPGTGALVKEGTQFSFTTELAFVLMIRPSMIDDHFDGPAGSAARSNFWSIDNPNLLPVRMRR